MICMCYTSISNRNESHHKVGQLALHIYVHMCMLHFAAKNLIIPLACFIIKKKETKKYNKKENKLAFCLLSDEVANRSL